jgi:hypothetical protein
VKKARGAQPLKLRLLDALYIGFEETNAADKGDDVVLAVQYGFFLFFSNIARELDLLVPKGFTKEDIHVIGPSVSQSILLYENDHDLVAWYQVEGFPNNTELKSKTLKEFIHHRYHVHAKKVVGTAVAIPVAAGVTSIVPSAKVSVIPTAQAKVVSPREDSHSLVQATAIHSGGTTRRRAHATTRTKTTRTTTTTRRQRR